MNDDPGMNETLRRNIARLTERRATELREAPLSERLARRIGDAAGSMGFVYLHLVLFGGWIAVNQGWLPLIAPFDPTMVVLAMIASVEAIFLSTFVLITQNRMAEAADQRADLDLHINLLAEHELTRVARAIEQVSAHLGIAPAQGFEEVKRDIEPATVLDAIHAHDEAVRKQ